MRIILSEQELVRRIKQIAAEEFGTDPSFVAVNLGMDVSPDPQITVEIVIEDDE